MKRLGALAVLLFLLSGCTGETKEMQQALELRSTLLAREGCSFTADITADYGDSLEQFSMDCKADSLGNIRFEVTKPESISGITGTLSDQGGRLTFDDHALLFDYLTDDQLSPVCAPWVFLRTLRGGYLTGAGREGENIHLYANHSYEEDALQADIWLEPGAVPVRSEILFRNRRILTLEIRDFLLSPAHA